MTIICLSFPICLSHYQAQACIVGFVFVLLGTLSLTTRLVNQTFIWQNHSGLGHRKLRWVSKAKKLRELYLHGDGKRKSKSNGSPQATHVLSWEYHGTKWKLSVWHWKEEDLRDMFASCQSCHESSEPKQRSNARGYSLLSETYLPLRAELCHVNASAGRTRHPRCSPGLRQAWRHQKCSITWGKIKTRPAFETHLNSFQFWSPTGHN